MTTHIYLTRHGLSEHNLNTRVYMGRSPESQLVEEGREQARRLGERLARESTKGGAPLVEAIVASSLSRTMETAELIAAPLGIDRIEPEDGFWELSKGDWEGRMSRPPPPDLARELARDPFGYRYPGGESFRDVTERTVPVLERWLGRLEGQRVLFVLHGDVLRALVRHMMDIAEPRVQDFVVQQCSLSEIHLEDGRYMLARFNDCNHLDL